MNNNKTFYDTAYATQSDTDYALYGIVKHLEALEESYEQAYNTACDAMESNPDNDDLVEQNAAAYHRYQLLLDDIAMVKKYRSKIETMLQEITAMTEDYSD